MPKAVDPKVAFESKPDAVGVLTTRVVSDGARGRSLHRRDSTFASLRVKVQPGKPTDGDTQDPD